MKILVISQMYPHATNPHFGVFIQREVESLSGYCEQKVIVPRPWIPWNSRDKAMSTASRRNASHNNAQAEVRYQYYFPLPGAFFDPIKGFWFFIFSYNLIRRIKKTFDFDIIHAHKVYPEGFCAVLLKKLFKKPVIISIRGADINESPKHFLLRQQIRYALQKADAVITVSKSLKNRVMALRISDDKISVMPKGVDMALFRPMDRCCARKTLDLPQDKIIILSVGWLITRKNPFAFIRAALSVPEEKRKRYLFVMVGEGPLKRQIESAIQKSGLGPMFQLAGRVEPSQIPVWMNAADIFVLVSFSEGMPNVLYEAMACGLPLIASNVDGASEIIDSDQNGILVSPSDYQQISQQILGLAKNETLRKKLSQNSKAYMEGRQLEWQKNALWLMDIYQSIVAAH